MLNYLQILELVNNNLFYTKCNYKIGQICEVFFYQDDEKK